MESGSSIVWILERWSNWVPYFSTVFDISTSGTTIHYAYWFSYGGDKFTATLLLMPTWWSFQPLVSCLTVAVRWPSASEHITAEELILWVTSPEWFISLPLLLCRLSAHFLSEIWVLIGEWEQNGSRHVYWIMTHLQIMVTGHMEQVGPVFYKYPILLKSG